MGRSNLASRNIQRRQRDSLEAAPGYASSGESQWTRQAGAGGRVETSSIADTSTMSRLEFLIHTNVKELLNFQERVNTSSDPAEVARLTKNIGIKKRFLDRLRAEQRRGANA
jgi:hypothetical protein